MDLFCVTVRKKKPEFQLRFNSPETPSKLMYPSVGPQKQMDMGNINLVQGVGHRTEKYCVVIKLLCL